MPKGVVKIDSKKVDTFRQACAAADVEVEEPIKKIGTVTKAEVNFKTPQQLFEAGQYYISFDLDEEDEE